MAIKSLSIRIDEEMLNKLHVVADYEGRSANSQILIMIRNAIMYIQLIRLLTYICCNYLIETYVRYCSHYTPLRCKCQGQATSQIETHSFN